MFYLFYFFIQFRFLWSVLFLIGLTSTLEIMTQSSAKNKVSPEPKKSAQKNKSSKNKGAAETEVPKVSFLILIVNNRLLQKIKRIEKTVEIRHIEEAKVVAPIYTHNKKSKGKSSKKHSKKAGCDEEPDLPNAEQDNKKMQGKESNVKELPQAA